MRNNAGSKSLAREAGRIPESMLRFVLRDGFDYCSYIVNEVNEGLKSMERGERTYSTSEVLRHARSTSGKHGGRLPEAACLVRGGKAATDRTF